MARIFIIGGSPCSGKSTVAQLLSERYDLVYFKADDRMDAYTAMGAARGLEICSRLGGMTPEEIWMRDPALQCREELGYYREIADFVRQELEGICAGGEAVIAEGAAFLPSLMAEWGVGRASYLSLTPERDFQIRHYSQREWIGFALEGCTDKAKAFENWMERDCLFAREVERQCVPPGYRSIVNDGSRSVEALAREIAAHFGLTE